MRHVWFIALKDLRLFITDRLALGMFILFPFLFIVMFNLLLSNIGSEDTRLELHMATQEADGISLQIIQSMVTTDESSLAPGQPLIVWEKDYADARARVEAKTLDGFLAFPPDFSQKVQAGEKTSLEIVVQAEATNTRAALNGLAQSISSRLVSQRVAIQSAVTLLLRQGSSQAEIEQAIAGLIQDESQESPLIAYQSQNVGQIEAQNPSSFVVPGYLVMFVFFAAAVSSESIVRERQNHTLERLLASSVRKESIIGGIYLGNIFKGLVQIAIFWIFGIFVFNVDLGFAPWAVVLISLLMVLMSAAFSVMLATLVRTQRSAGALAVLVSLLLAPLGGCWWPLFIVPRWMQFIAKITPHGWANDGFNKLMIFGASPSAVTWNMVALIGFAAAFIIIAVLNFRTSADAT